MLYQWHELRKAVLTPLRLAAEAQASLLRNPMNPAGYTLSGRSIAAACDMFQNGTRPYAKPSFGFGTISIDGKPVAITERIVARRPFCQIKHFHRQGIAAGRHPRVLIVAPLSGHYATLLRGTVAKMLEDHDVYITDWRDARQVPVRLGSFDFDDYVDYLIDFLHELGPGTHVIAVCQPSVPVLAAVALMAATKDQARPRSMTLMGGPIDSRNNPTVPNRLATEHSIDWFERSVIVRVPINYPGFMRAVYPGFLQLGGFLSMNLGRHVGAHLRMFRHLVRGDGDSAKAHRDFYDEYNSVMDLPAEYYLQTIQRVFQEHQLARGVMHSRGRPIEPSAIDQTALMTVEGEFDDISGLGQTHAAHGLCTRIPPSRRVHYVQPGVGHYGVFNGRKWRSEIAPRIKAFIRAHDHDKP